VVAITLGLAAILFLVVAGAVRPGWVPDIRFTWFALVGSTVVVTVGVLFPTPERVVQRADLAANSAVP
jgi:hypothetical protein